mmetsp:Transcript_45991/g.127811  ORF Transcript_45991/g.127811 Transcript_45991/m.127811 type:complete len:236 (+) Transcript_45991:3220-3927(+)
MMLSFSVAFMIHAFCAAYAVFVPADVAAYATFEPAFSASAGSVGSVGAAPGARGAPTAVISPSIDERKEVLPEPTWPTTATSCPGSMTSGRSVEPSDPLYTLKLNGACFSLGVLVKPSASASAPIFALPSSGSSCATEPTDFPSAAAASVSVLLEVSVVSFVGTAFHEYSPHTSTRPGFADDAAGSADVALATPAAALSAILGAALAARRIAAASVLSGRRRKRLIRVRLTDAMT